MGSGERKKLATIGILTKENAPDWFRLMESQLRGEKLWKTIQDVIEKRGASATAATPAATPEGTQAATPESSGSSNLSIDDELKLLARNEDWDAKNWKAITAISLLLSALDRHTVQSYQYAGDIWTYLKKFYSRVIIRHG